MCFIIYYIFYIYYIYNLLIKIIYLKNLLLSLHKIIKHVIRHVFNRIKIIKNKEPRTNHTENLSR